MHAPRRRSRTGIQIAVRLKEFAEDKTHAKNPGSEAVLAAKAVGLRALCAPDRAALGLRDPPRAPRFNLRFDLAQPDGKLGRLV
jgi:hypothetical protein